MRSLVTVAQSDGALGLRVFLGCSSLLVARRLGSAAPPPRHGAVPGHFGCARTGDVWVTHDVSVGEVGGRGSREQ